MVAIVVIASHSEAIPWFGDTNKWIAASFHSSQ